MIMSIVSTKLVLYVGFDQLKTSQNLVKCGKKPVTEGFSPNFGQIGQSKF